MANKIFKGVKFPGMDDYYVLPEAVITKNEDGIIEIESMIASDANVGTDASLSISGMAADAAAVGERFDSLDTTIAVDENSDGNIEIRSYLPEQDYLQLDKSLTVEGAAADAKASGDAIKEIGTAILLQVYPVGSIYMSLDSTSPAELFGGTWERILGRFLLAAHDGSGYYGGATGGEATHTLTVEEMPQHYHTTNGAAFLNPSQDAQNAYAVMRGTNLNNIMPNGVATPTTNNTGGGQAHNNMPPYLAVYMWKRIA